MTVRPNVIQVLYLIVVVGLVTTGCGNNERLLGSRADGLTKEEIRFVAWWAEDVAHGGIRNPEELIKADNSPAMNRLAHWAYGRIYNNEGSGRPPVLRDRRQRWPLIAAALAQKTVILDDEGLPFLNTNDEATIRLIAAAVQEERADRLSTFSRFLSVGEITPGSPAATYAADELRRARFDYLQALNPHE